MTDLFQRMVLLAAGLAVGTAVVAILPLLLRALGFERPNFQGRPIATAAGILYLAAGTLWVAIGPAAELLLATAVTGFGLLGLIDDRWGTAEFKGLRGHLRAFLSGRITTGFLKAFGGAALAGWLGWRINPGWGALPGALLIALMANLFNLLDLRPLRTLKAFWAISAGLIWTGPLLPALLLGLSLPYARLEARRRVMLGDVGANALGAGMGAALALLLPAPLQGVLVTALLLFHVWAEKHSLSTWIAQHPWARAIDRWGWSEELG